MVYLYREINKVITNKNKIMNTLENVTRQAENLIAGLYAQQVEKFPNLAGKKKYCSSLDRAKKELSVYSVYTSGMGKVKNHILFTFKYDIE